jgi:hypothetical protein
VFQFIAKEEPERQCPVLCMPSFFLFPFEAETGMNELVDKVGF